MWLSAFHIGNVAGEKFVIETTNNSHENKYAQQYELNGKVLTEPSVAFEAIVKGGNLSVVMGNTPKDNWKLPSIL